MAEINFKILTKGGVESEFLDSSRVDALKSGQPRKPMGAAKSAAGSQASERLLARTEGFAAFLRGKRVKNRENNHNEEKHTFFRLLAIAGLPDGVGVVVHVVFLVLDDIQGENARIQIGAEAAEAPARANGHDDGGQAQEDAAQTEDDGRDAQGVGVLALLPQGHQDGGHLAHATAQVAQGHPVGGRLHDSLEDKNTIKNRIKSCTIENKNSVNHYARLFIRHNHYGD